MVKKLLIITMKRKYIFLVTIVLLSVSCKQKFNNSLSNFEMYKIDSLIIFDEKINEFIQPYKDSLESIMNKRIGINDHELAGYKPDSPLSSFVADILLQKGREFLSDVIDPEDNHPSISIINVRGLRTSLRKGEITVNNIIQIVPFDNLLVALLITGEIMEELFSHIANSYGDGIAGATCDLTSSGMNNIKINDKELNKDSLYWVFVSDYIAEGGDRYFILQNYIQKIEFTKKVNDLIVEYIQELNEKNIEINYVYNPRIKVVND